MSLWENPDRLSRAARLRFISAAVLAVILLGVWAVRGCEVPERPKTDGEIRARRAR